MTGASLSLKINICSSEFVFDLCLIFILTDACLWCISWLAIHRHAGERGQRGAGAPPAFHLESMEGKSALLGMK